MFSAVLLAYDEDACILIERLATESKQVSFEKILYRFPAPHELGRMLNGLAPDLVFLELSDRESALLAAAEIHGLSPHTPIIGFGGRWAVDLEAQSAAAGITELMVSPITLKTFEAGVERAINKTASRTEESIFAFLPSKAGSGSTTVALNTAGCLAGVDGNGAPLKDILLIEGDLNSGVLSVLLDIVHPHSLRDALENSSELDYSQWSRFVVKSHGFDVLLSDHARRSPLPSWANYHHLLDYAAAQYDTILVDLPEVVNDATIETVRRAKRVFVVCTPELTSLALAENRLEELRSRGVAPEKIGIVLNRWHRDDIKAADLGKILKHEVCAVFRNDYRTVAAACGARGLVGLNTKLGKSYAAFGRQLAGTPKAARGFSPFSFLKGFGAKAAPQPRA
jgi:pilus assembly protein CpaE